METTLLIELYKKSNQFGSLMEMHLDIISAGKVTYTMTIQPKHLATPIAAHGGVIAAIVDGALGVAALSLTVKENKVVSTVEFKINYLQPALLGDTIKATGEVVRAGKKLLFVICEVLNQKNELIAVANGTFNAYPAERIFGNEWKEA